MRTMQRAELPWGVEAHCGLLAGGAPQHSLHLTALVQLVKEIPGFLFGEVSPESGGASLDGEQPSPEGKLDSRAASAVRKVKFKLWQHPVPCACLLLPGPRWSRLVSWVPWRRA